MVFCPSEPEGKPIFWLVYSGNLKVTESFSLSNIALQMTLLDGKKTSDIIKQEIAAQVNELVAFGNRAPHLVAVLVGNNGASETYVANKVKACEKVGFRSTLLRFDESTSEAHLLDEIGRLNSDPEVDGFIVQLPL